MSKGGGDQVTVQEPNSIVRPFLSDLYNRARSETRDPPEYFSGDTYVGMLPEEQSFFDQQFSFLDSVYGDGGPYSDMIDANGRLLSGDTLAGNTGSGVANAFSGNLGVFGGSPSMVGDYQSTFNPSAVNLGFDNPSFSSPDLNVSGFTPGTSKTVTSDPNAAINSMLSGEADLSGVSDVVNAAAQPTLDILREDIMPSIVSQAVGTNNQSSLAKDINRIVPRVMEDISNQGTQLGFAEMQAAKNRQANAAALATQAGLSQSGQDLQAYGLGLQGAGTQAGLDSTTDQFLANLGLNAAGTQAGLDQSYQELMSSLGLSNANLGLQSDIAQSNEANSYRDDVLGLGDLTNNFSQQELDAIVRGSSVMPSVINTGLMPSQAQGEYADFLRGIEESALADDINRFNFNEYSDRDMLNWYSQILGGTAGIGGTTTQPAQPGGLAGAVGGAAAGAGLASSLGMSNPYTALLAVGGGLAGSK